MPDASHTWLLVKLFINNLLLVLAYGQNWRYFHLTGSKSKQLVLA